MPNRNRVNVLVSFPWALILTIVFICLKAAGTITWSWIWVFSPLWITVGVVICIIGAALLIAFLAAVFGS